MPKWTCFQLVCGLIAQCNQFSKARCPTQQDYFYYTLGTTDLNWVTATIAESSYPDSKLPVPKPAPRRHSGTSFTYLGPVTQYGAQPLATPSSLTGLHETLGSSGGQRALTLQSPKLTDRLNARGLTTTPPKGGSRFPWILPHGAFPQRQSLTRLTQEAAKFIFAPTHAHASRSSRHKRAGGRNRGHGHTPDLGSETRTLALSPLVAAAVSTMAGARPPTTASDS